MIHHSKPTLDIKDAVLFKPVLESGLLAAGRMVAGFEGMFARFVKTKGAVAVNSGTSALHLSLLALGVGRGDEVIMPSYACTALLDAVNYTGAGPVLVDVEYDTCNISLGQVKKKLTRRTAAIIMPHMFGLPCDIGEILDLGVPVIEDCAQSLGAKYKNRPTGSFGVLSVFSFYATKVMTTGYGGMVASGSDRLLGKIRDLVSQDKRESYKTRYNSRMSEIQAALGIRQLKGLPGFLTKRKQLALVYTKCLAGCGFELPAQKDDREHIFYRYVIKSDNPARLKKHLAQNNIEVIPPVHKPLHRYLRMGAGGFGATEKIFNSIISLPIYPSLKRSEQEKVMTVLRRASK